MSTYAGYHIDLPLRADVAHDADWFLERPEFHYNGPVGRGRNPGFGAAFHYAGRDYSQIAGVHVEGDRLKVGGWGQNIERPDDRDALGHSRLEVLLAFLTDSTSAKPGDIVGCIWFEHGTPDHADPLVVCSDGMIRMVSTTPVPAYSGMLGDHAPDPETLIRIGDVLPADAIEIGDGQACLEEKALLAAIAPDGERKVMAPPR